MSENAQEPPFDPAAILIDPEVPEGPRQVLADLARVYDAAGQYPLVPQTYQPRLPTTAQPKAALIRFKDPVEEDPPGRPERPTPPPAPRAQTREDLDKRSALRRRWGVSVPIGAAGALISGFAGIIWLAVLLTIFALSAFSAWIWALTWEPPDIRKARLEQMQYERLEQAYQVFLDQWQRRHAAVIYHRCYVIPDADLDSEGRLTWEKAVQAANRVYASEAVDQALIDSEQVKAIMPYRLWEIGKRLARIATLRDQQGTILQGVSPDHPDIAPIVTRQRRALELATEDVNERVGKLEVLADRLERADTAKRHEAIVLRLASLNDPLREIVADRAVSIGQPETDDRANDDIEAVIEQSRQAIHEANEAALSLVLPDDREDDAADTRDQPPRPMALRGDGLSRRTICYVGRYRTPKSHGNRPCRPLLFSAATSGMDRACGVWAHTRHSDRAHTVATARRSQRTDQTGQIDPIDANEDRAVVLSGFAWLDGSSKPYLDGSVKPKVARCRPTMAPHLAPARWRLRR